MSNSLQLIEESFERVRPRAPEFAASFYKNLFKAYPEVEPLFAETDRSAQEQKFISMLMLVVFNLHYPQNLIDTLQELGASHVQYGALPSHYPLVGHALLTTFEQYLGKQWTREVKQAWVDAYADITALMLAGAEYDGETVKLEAPRKKAGAGGASQISQTHDHKAEPVDGTINWLLVGGTFGVGGLITILLLLL